MPPLPVTARLGKAFLLFIWPWLLTVISCTKAQNISEGIVDVSLSSRWCGKEVLTQDFLGNQDVWLLLFTFFMEATFGGQYKGLFAEGWSQRVVASETGTHSWMCEYEIEPEKRSPSYQEVPRKSAILGGYGTVIVAQAIFSSCGYSHWHTTHNKAEKWDGEKRLLAAWPIGRSGPKNLSFHSIF